MYRYDVRPPTSTEAAKLRDSVQDLECGVLAVPDAAGGTVNGYAIGGPFRDVVEISAFALE